MMMRRCSDQDIREPRGMTSTPGGIRELPGDTDTARSTGSIRSPYRWTRASSHPARSAASRVAPSRRAFAIPSSIPATVTTGKKSASGRIVHPADKIHPARRGSTPARNFRRAPRRKSHLESDQIHQARSRSQKPVCRIGVRSRSGRSSGLTGTAISKRPKDGTRDRRSHSSKLRITASGLPCRVMTDGRPRIASSTTADKIPWRHTTGSRAWHILSYDYSIHIHRRQQLSTSR